MSCIEFSKRDNKMLGDKFREVTQSYGDQVEVSAERLARDVVLYLLGEDLGLLVKDELSVCVRNCVVEMLGKHAILFTSFAKRLAVVPEKTREAFEEVSNELFLEDVTWSRIIAMYALAGRLALHYEENNNHKLARNIPQYMTSCITKKIAPYVRRNGGWEQLCTEFPSKEDVNGKVWRYLLLTGAGLGLLAALLAVHS